MSETGPPPSPREGPPPQGRRIKAVESLPMCGCGCGQVLAAVGSRVDKIYASVACRQRAWRRNRAPLERQVVRVILACNRDDSDRFGPTSSYKELEHADALKRRNGQDVPLHHALLEYARAVLPSDVLAALGERAVIALINKRGKPALDAEMAAVVRERMTEPRVSQCRGCGQDMLHTRERKRYPGVCFHQAHGLCRRCYNDQRAVQRRLRRDELRTDVIEVCLLFDPAGAPAKIRSRERDAAIAELTRRGRSTRELADYFGITHRTVTRSRTRVRVHAERITI